MIIPVKRKVKAFAESSQNLYPCVEGAQRWERNTVIPHKAVDGQGGRGSAMDGPKRPARAGHRSGADVPAGTQASGVCAGECGERIGRETEKTLLGAGDGDIHRRAQAPARNLGRPSWLSVPAVGGQSLRGKEDFLFLPYSESWPSMANLPLRRGNVCVWDGKGRPFCKETKNLRMKISFLLET